MSENVLFDIICLQMRETGALMLQARSFHLVGHHIAHFMDPRQKCGLYRTPKTVKQNQYIAKIENKMKRKFE